MPQHDEDNPHLYSPAIKWGVQPGSFTHCTEFFGPVLGVMPARDIHEAIELVNQTGYGLTSGWNRWTIANRKSGWQRVRAGNLYVNPWTTGAIVLRQPFGGMGKSAFGPGIKAGGPNYVAQLMTSRKPASHRAANRLATPCWGVVWRLDQLTRRRRRHDHPDSCAADQGGHRQL